MSDILAYRPFIRATVTNFFFFSAVNGFVLLPLYIERLGGTPVEVGLIMGLYSAVGIVLQPLVGPWTDLFGRRPFMLLGVAMVLASSLLAAVVNAVGWLALVRVMQGIGFSVFFVANFSHVLDLIPPERRGWALGIYGVSGFLSTALAPLFGEFVIRKYSFHYLFALTAVLALVAGALVMGMRENERPPGAPVRGVEWARMGLREAFHRHMAVTLFFGLGTGTVFAFVPTFAESIGVTTLALFYTAYAGAAMATRIFGGHLIDSLGRRAVIVPSMLAVCAASGLLSLLGVFVDRHSTMPDVPVLFVAGLLSGTAHGFLYPGLAALATDRTPGSRRGFVIGVFSAIFLVGNASGAFAFGWVAHGLGYWAMWALLTALLLIGFGLSLRLAGYTATS
ncbi:MAG: MFS transporter [Candidatus Rokubacteria bacterium]|nr:MFS transporter [Candidatus Rokubacteria bacterium]